MDALMRICPVCLQDIGMDGYGLVEEHRDTATTRCPMSSRDMPEWDEQATRPAVKGRSMGYCEFCRSAKGMEMHHRMGRGQRGLWTPANILHLCSAHHRHATINPDWAYAMGVSCRHNEDPETKLVVRMDGSCFQPTSMIAPPLPKNMPRRKP